MIILYSQNSVLYSSSIALSMVKRFNIGAEILKQRILFIPHFAIDSSSRTGQLENNLRVDSSSENSIEFRWRVLRLGKSTEAGTLSTNFVPSLRYTSDADVKRPQYREYLEFLMGKQRSSS